MKRILYVLLVLLWASCQQDDDLQPVRVIPELVKPQVDRFLLEAQRRGVALDISKLSFEFEQGLETPLQGLAVASCTRTEDLHLVTIDTTNNFWIHGGEMGREEVVFHELGHCLLLRPHKEDLLATDDFRSIMRAQGPLSYGSFNTFLKGSIVHRRDYYVDELFDETTPDPCWAHEEVVSPFPLQIFDEDFLNRGSTYEMVLDEWEDLWVCGQNKMYRFFNDQFELIPFQYDVNVLTDAGEEGLWLAARDGSIGKLGLYKDGDFVELYQDTVAGGPIFNLNQMIVDAHGRLWFGTIGGQIFVQNELGELQEIPDQSASPAWKMLVAPDGTLYMLKGFDLLIFKDTLIPQEVNVSNSGFPSGFLRDIAVDQQGVAWIAVDGFEEVFLVRYSEGQVEILELGNLNMPVSFVKALRADSHGDIWLATSNGIRKWEGEYFSNYCTYNTANPILNFSEILVDSRGTVWCIGQDPSDLRRKFARVQIGS